MNTRHGLVAAQSPIAEDICPTCGAKMLAANGELTQPINGEIQSIFGIEHLACPRCGERLLALLAARQLQQAAVLQYQTRHGLLRASEIRLIRKRLQLSQAELANLLQLGPNTFSRWETGRSAQTGAMDILLRLLRDVPGVLGYVRARAA